QQDMLALYVNLRAEKNLSGIGIRVVELSLHKLANHVQLQFTNQVSHEHKTVLHHADHMNGFTPEITGDLARHLLYALFYLLRGEEHSRVFRSKIFRPVETHSSASALIIISSIRTASPELLAKS